MNRAEKEKLLAELMALDEVRRYNKLSLFKAYPKQTEFFATGLWANERMLRAGNQQGKTEAGAFEAAVHLTGRYPNSWPGRRWDRPVRAWLAGETSLLVRDVQQAKLCGTPGLDEAWGTGLIPRDTLVDKSLARGVTDAYDTIQVRHVSGGVSTATFKSYEQGRPKFQGEPIDFGWGDEECPMDIYTELLARISATDGMVYETFTPLKGRTDLVMHFDEPGERRALVTMTILDALHIPEARRQQIIDSYPAHQRDARVRGIPLLGEGRIFDFSEEIVAEEPFEYVPPHWRKLWAIDFGIGHPFAAVLFLYDADNDVLHVHHVIRMKDGRIRDHVAAMRAVAAAVPVAWPHDGHKRDSASGDTLAAQYKNPGPGTEGLKMLPEHATWADGGYSTEAGILEMDDRMRTGRLKVAKHLVPWFDEFREYHRKDGQIVKVRDDIMSATRIGVMAKRKAQVVTLGSKSTNGRPKHQIADGVENWEPWG